MYKAHCNLCDSIMTDAMTPAYHTTLPIKGEAIIIEVYVKTGDKAKDHICIGCLRNVLQTMDCKERAVEGPINAR